VRVLTGTILVAAALSLVVVTRPGARDGAPAGDDGEGRVGVRLLGIPEADGSRSAAPDLRRFWQAVRAGDLDTARELLARARRRSPDWEPPADAVAALTGRALSEALDAAAADGDWAAIRALARENADGFTCARPDRLWLLTDALAAEFALDPLQERYAAMLAECTAEADRLYVLERALVQLPPDAVGNLVARVDPEVLSPDGRAQYESVRRRLSDRFVTRALAAGRLDEAAKRAASLEDPTAALELAWRYNATGREAEARRWFDRAIAWGGADEARYGAALVAVGQGALGDAEAYLDRIEKPDGRSVRLRRSIETVRAERAAQAGDPAALAALAERRRDAGRAVALGWGLDSGGDPEGARTWFERAVAWDGGDPARLGLATVALKAGDRDAARAALDGLNAPTPESRRLEAGVLLAEADAALDAGDAAKAERLAREAARVADGSPAVAADDLIGAALLARADDAYDAGDVAAARDLAREARGYPSVARAAAVREAWALHRSGEAEAAAAAFREIWDSADTARTRDAVGEGLYLSLADAGRTAEARALAAEAPGSRLAAAVDAADARAALDRKDFVTAHALAPDAYPELDGVAGPWAAQTAALRYTEGDPGRGRFVGLIGRTAVGGAFGPDVVAGSLTEYAVDIGSPEPGDPVGTPGRPFAVEPTDGLVAVAPRLSWRREGRASPFAALGTTPIGGVVSPLPVGDVGLSFRGEGGRTARAAVFARSRADSLLSLSGLRDPATGERWGRVVEWGVEADGRLPLGERWSAGLEGGVSRLTGRDVIDNTRVRAGASLAYDLDEALGLDGFDYLTVGPSYGFDRYAENTNFWTFGHGGYFSPQRYHRLAANVNLLTEERRDWIVRLDASAGWEWIEEDPAVLLPLDAGPGAPRAAGGSSNGPTATARLEAAWRVAPRWMLAGFVSGATSDGFQDVFGGLTLRHSFGGRASVVSTDLDPRPQEVFRR